jgi:hypothetical protein
MHSCIPSSLQPHYAKLRRHKQAANKTAERLARVNNRAVIATCSCCCSGCLQAKKAYALQRYASTHTQSSANQHYTSALHAEQHLHAEQQLKAAKAGMYTRFVNSSACNTLIPAHRQDYLAPP